MDIEKRLKYFHCEREKILGFSRSHLRSVRSTRTFYREIQKKVHRCKLEFSNEAAFQSWLWETVRMRCDEILRGKNLQFRVLDSGTIDQLDRALIERSGISVEERITQVQSALHNLPESASRALHSIYRDGENCESISKKLGLPLDEAYQLWQHAVILLWEAARSVEIDQVLKNEDEAFWAMSLRYLDGSASEKFVAGLNREIHVNSARMTEFNDLRIIDGAMIEFGLLDSWPGDAKGTNGKKIQFSPEENETLRSIREALKNAAAQTGKWIAAALVSTAKGLTAAKNLTAERWQSRRTTTKTGPRSSPPPGTDEENDASPPEEESSGQAEGPVLNQPEPGAGSRPGVQFDDGKRIRPRFQVRNLDPIWLKRGGVFVTALLATVVIGALAEKNRARKWKSAPFSGPPVILRSADLAFSAGSPSGNRIRYGRYVMDSGTAHFHTASGVGIIVEGPSEFSIKSDNQFTLKKGRMVVLIPQRDSLKLITIATDQFSFSAEDGEFGVLVDDESSDVIAFSGMGTIRRENRLVPPGTGLRYFETGEPDVIESRTEAYRFPDFIPTAVPRTYGDNLVLNHSFEVGLLSRSCKTERLYRDVPTGWKAGWKKEGVWTEAMEQHSGTVRITDAIGGLPSPVHGERYLWINHGFVSQELPGLEAGAAYELSVQVASHRNFGPGAGHLIENVGGNTFRFGIWAGENWIAETSGQLQAGQPFQMMTLPFSIPGEAASGSIPLLMLTGETRVFYDEVVLRKTSPSLESASSE